MVAGLFVGSATVVVCFATAVQGDGWGVARLGFISVVYFVTLFAWTRLWAGWWGAQATAHAGLAFLLCLSSVVVGLFALLLVGSLTALADGVGPFAEAVVAGLPALFVLAAFGAPMAVFSALIFVGNARIDEGVALGGDAAYGLCEQHLAAPTDITQSLKSIE